MFYSLYKFATNISFAYIVPDDANIRGNIAYQLCTLIGDKIKLVEDYRRIEAISLVGQYYAIY